MKERKRKLRDCKMAERKRCFNELSRNNGSTLIEVIVCVLIIGIVFVPLMVGLNASLRINRETENKLYAENVASNIVEICKTFGVHGLEELKEINHDSTNGIKAFLAGDSVTLSQSGDDPEFTITGISSGKENKYYQADIIFADNHNYDVNQNNFEGLPTISGLSNAAIVSFGADDFNTVVTRFLTIAQNNGSTVTEAELKSNIGSWLKRQITLTIEEKVVEGKTRYVIKRKIEYIVESGATVNGKDVIHNSLINKVVYESQPTESIKIYYSSGSSDVIAFGSADEEESYNVLPQSIIVTYSELKSESGDYLSFNAPSSNPFDMVVEKNVAGNVNVYAICADSSLLAGHHLNIFAEGTECGISPDYQVSAYSNLTSSSPNNCKLLTEFGEGASGKNTKIKDVTIYVYEDINGVRGNQVAELESTIIEFE